MKKNAAVRVAYKTRDGLCLIDAQFFNEQLRGWQKRVGLHTDCIYLSEQLSMQKYRFYNFLNLSSTSLLHMLQLMFGLTSNM